MRRATLAWAGGVVVLATAAAVAWQPDGSRESSARSVQLPAPTPAATLAAVRASPSPSPGLGHAQPPDPEALRDAPHRQAVYDAEAQPGEFVTPPNVSIAH